MQGFVGGALVERVTLGKLMTRQSVENIFFSSKRLKCSIILICHISGTSDEDLVGMATRDEARMEW